MGRVRDRTRNPPRTRLGQVLAAQTRPEPEKWHPRPAPYGVGPGRVFRVRVEIANPKPDNKKFNRMEERCSVNSPRRILSFSRNRRADVSFPDVDDRSSTGFGVSGEHGPKLSERILCLMKAGYFNYAMLLLYAYDTVSVDFCAGDVPLLNGEM
ncbi:hypothetical protein Sango_0166700 [Sesamum angolense]|uniref:Uncharacterized protein n=1 Tax=Sesamum angolense TaxID=2727404 RepID=A0AAE1XGC8_9LAMI|nr:hypothetical protein Sango_0166700 [Sesamum angolense]